MNLVWKKLSNQKTVIAENCNRSKKKLVKESNLVEFTVRKSKDIPNLMSKYQQNLQNNYKTLSARPN